ncbi:PREDICTED: uncharacterized protein LOC104600112 isoform X1 [Nelumbo nucifera]|uniref:Uncharacterized protein LOC104600112 isoform X1 n=1 Tax=Nelumbo nucifera TaxID=4432 RepID=A0A1U8AGX3_NELNU|nr:PREDICTED: uncharacterized protein LOC104600112 isoform X1 [Nelumbo nucifera]XP_010261249.1 PREDICTED: uncharacterized protein LOC104600112 isoform X1 [Nelumbo nucifera]XP_010261250.1 PREDICTED: uncharacterized protein LOC104600112 isoform X1 [Nelumbo nucifera]
MGCAISRAEKDEALRLCKERKRFIKQAIDSRYALAVAHLCYVQSLRNIGVALRRFAETEVLAESSLSTSATELDKSPSHFSYPSPSPSHNAEATGSPMHNESPLSPPPSNLSYMRSGGTAAVTVTINPSFNNTSFVDDESSAFPLPPPPPPPETDSSWDFFDPSDEMQSFRFMEDNGFDFVNGLRQFREDEIVPFSEESGKKQTKIGLRRNTFAGSLQLECEQRPGQSSGNSAIESKGSGGLAITNGHSLNATILEKNTPVYETKLHKPDYNANGPAETLSSSAVLEKSISQREKTGSQKDFCEEREDPSEFITHRAKDFLSSIKDIEHRFFRASESGKEVSRMLEANKIRLNFSESRDLQQMTKIITWNRSTSSRSSSSKNPLATMSKDDIDDSGSDFVEEFCMIAGSHSSTLDRLYAWERKLYDEIKASESIRKEYDQKCDQLRHQFAKDVNPKVMDKTRAVIKDLHSRIGVAIHAVDSISKRIEKLRDEELQPQLVELIQGLIRMWKAMLECHHAQYITISLAYHAKGSTAGPPQGESYRQVLAQLQHEVECFGSSFADWNSAQRSYVEALNGWLQNCIRLPQERSKGRRAFCPRRALAPPIFVLCLEWLAGIKALPSEELAGAIKTFASDLHSSMGQKVEEQQKKQGPSELDDNGESGTKDETDEKCSNLSSICKSLTRVLHQLTKFAEASVKTYEDIRQGSESARLAYINGRTT